MAEATPTTSLIPGRPQTDPVTNSLIERQSLALSTVSNQLFNISQQMSAMNNSLQVVQQNIAQNTFLDRQREAQKAEQERLLAQQALREGKEGAIEAKIQNALIKPVNSVAAKAQGILGRLTNFFQFVLGGWIANQFIDWMNAKSEDNKDDMNRIQIHVGKTLATIVGLFFAFKWGIRGLFGIIGTVVGKLGTAVWRNLIKRPFAAVLTFLGAQLANFMTKLRGMVPWLPKTASTVSKAAAPIAAGATASTVTRRPAPSGGKTVGAFSTGAELLSGTPPGEAVAVGAGSGLGWWGASKLASPLMRMGIPGKVLGGALMLGGSWLGGEGARNMWTDDDNKEQSQFPTGINVDQFLDREGIQPMNIDDSNAFRAENPELFATGEDLDLINQERAMFGQPPLPDINRPLTEQERLVNEWKPGDPKPAGVLDHDDPRLGVGMEVDPNMKSEPKKEGRGFWGTLGGITDAITLGATDFDKRGSEGQLFGQKVDRNIGPTPKPKTQFIPMETSSATSAVSSSDRPIDRTEKAASRIPRILSNNSQNPYALAQQANFNVLMA